MYEPTIKKAIEQFQDVAVGIPTGCLDDVHSPSGPYAYFQLLESLEHASETLARVRSMVLMELLSMLADHADATRGA